MITDSIHVIISSGTINEGIIHVGTSPFAFQSYGAGGAVTNIIFPSGLQAILDVKYDNPSYYGSAGYKRTLTLKNPSGDNLTNYPVFFELDNSFNFDHARQDGNDIRFLDSNGINLRLYKEYYSYINRSARFLVEVSDITTSGNTILTMTYGNSAVTEDVSTTGVFILFDDFGGGQRLIMPAGGDSGWSSFFDPKSRRFYRLGFEDAGEALRVMQWANIDNGDIGYAPYKSTKSDMSAVAYHPIKKRAYVYGGRTDTGNSGKNNEIWEFDPNPEKYTWTLLSETLPSVRSFSGQSAVYYPGDDKIYVGGGLVGEGSGAISDHIFVHDVNNGTFTDTGSVFPTGLGDIGGAYSAESDRIYWVGGENGGSSHHPSNRIYSYDASNPSTNPVITDTVLSDRITTPGIVVWPSGAEDYLFVIGGFRNLPNNYSDNIRRIKVNGGSLIGSATSPTVATMNLADDDMNSWWDHVNQRIYFGPVLATGSAQNEDERKMIIHEFDPITSTLTTEPTLLGNAPSGWSNAGNSTKLSAASVGGKLRIYEFDAGKFVRASKSIPVQTGEVMIEWGVSIGHTSDNHQHNIYGGSSHLITLRTNNPLDGTSWNIYNGSDQSAFAVVVTGDQVIGLKLDVPNRGVFGLVDRSNITGRFPFRNNGDPDMLQINGSTAEKPFEVVNWFGIRKSTRNPDPTISMGDETGN